MISTRSDIADEPIRPFSEIESKLVRIWADVLQCECVEANDNYFSLGGNSLLALTLISRIESAFGMKLPVSSIVEAPTVAEFAAIIENQGSPKPVIVIREGDNDQPVFLVHDADGETMLYRNLALRLNPKHAVYGIRPFSKPSLPILHTKLDEMAAFYIKNIKEIQARGPYVIGGLCAGGLIAFEMARQLERDGDSVAVVALMDAADVSAKERPMRIAKARFARLASTLDQGKDTSKLLRLVNVSKTATRKAFNLTKYLVSSRAKGILTKSKMTLFRAHLSLGLRLPRFLHNISVRTVYNHAKRLYRPSTPIRGELLLIRASGDSGAVGDDPYVGRYNDPLMGWELRTTKGVRVLDVPGGHFSMLQEPHVKELAEHLQKYIDSALDTQSPAAEDQAKTSGAAPKEADRREAVALAPPSGVEEKATPVIAVSTSAKNTHILRLVAASLEDLNVSAARLAGHVETLPDQDFSDARIVPDASPRDADWRRVVVGGSRSELIERLRKGTGKGVWTNAGRLVKRRPAFIIAGVGEQAAGAGRELYDSELVFREAVDECSEILEPVLGRDIRKEMLAPQKSTTNWMRGGGAGILKETRVAQPAAFILNWALARLWMSWGVMPSAVLGYSVGEYVAAALAGVLRMEDALIMLARRAEWIDEMAQPGAMLAVTIGEAEILPRMQDGTWLAAVNSPQATVVGGHEEAVQRLEKELQEAGVAARRVVSMNGTHTPLLAPVKANLKRFAEGVKSASPRIPMLSNVTGTWLTDQDARNSDYWGEHMCGTLRFEAGIGELLRDQQSVFLEIGPGAGLGAMVRQHTLCGREQMGRVFTSLPASWDKASEKEHIAATLGRLWIEGVEADWDSYDTRKSAPSRVA